MKVDVAVIGGGSAGIAAAIRAARDGARVLLAEMGAVPGGNATGALVHSLCGLYLLRGFAAESPVYANPGFPREIAEALLARGGARGPVRMGRLDVLLHTPAAFSAQAMELLRDLPDLHLCLNTELVAACQNGDGSLGGVVLRSDGRDFTVETSAVVDTTGDAGVAALAGVSCDLSPPDRLQRPAHILGLGGVPDEVMSDNGRLGIAHAISSGVSAKRLPQAALGASFRRGVGEGEVWMTIDLDATGFDPTIRNADRGELLRESRELGILLLEFLRRDVAGFQDATAIHHPDKLGIRESRRAFGIYRLTESDVLEGRRFSDEVALSAWPVELRETARGPRFRFPLEDRPCGIPLRSLQSATISNLFMAGRCLSATHEAHAALRVIGTSLATGEAAGKAAAMFAAASSTLGSQIASVP